MLPSFIIKSTSPKPCFATLRETRFLARSPSDSIMTKWYAYIISIPTANQLEEGGEERIYFYLHFCHRGTCVTHPHADPTKECYEYNDYIITALTCSLVFLLGGGGGDGGGVQEGERGFCPKL